MKRLISILLIISMVLSFCSCGGGEDDITTTEKTSTTGTVSTTESTTEKVDVNTPDNPTETTANSTPNNEETTVETTTQVPTVKVTIPEGYTLVRISWLLEEKGFCTSEEFIEATQNYETWLDLTQYPFLNDLQNAENVCFKLEGYFFPLTYDIPENATAQEIIKMFLNGTKQRLNDSFMARVQQSGYSVHKILTYASIIEKEAFLDEHRPMISSVLHNRVEAGMMLQCDPTVKYCTGVIEHIYPAQIDHYKYYYNTYRCKGLPAGPICNPGMKSIEAALNPADTDYYYFIIGTVEPYESKYSETFDEHQKFWAENKDRLTGGNS